MEHPSVYNASFKLFDIDRKYDINIDTILIFGSYLTDDTIDIPDKINIAVVSDSFNGTGNREKESIILDEWGKTDLPQIDLITMSIDEYSSKINSEDHFLHEAKENGIEQRSYVIARNKLVGDIQKTFKSINFDVENAKGLLEDAEGDQGRSHLVEAMKIFSMDHQSVIEDHELIRKDLEKGLDELKQARNKVSSGYPKRKIDKAIEQLENVIYVLEEVDFTLL